MWVPPKQISLKNSIPLFLPKWKSHALAFFPPILYNTPKSPAKGVSFVNRRALSSAFAATLPVLFGFIPLGIAFGLLMDAAGYNVLWSFFMSLFVYAGSAQFLGVEMLSSMVSLGQVAVMTLILNFRHLVYGLSMLEKYRGMGMRKLYMIFALPDETYALLSSGQVPEGVDPHDYYFAVAALNQIYWVTGSVLGGLLGAALTINTQGADFAMTALFVVIAVGQWEDHKNRLPALLGLGVAVLSLLLVGPDRFLIPTLAVIILALLSLRGRLETREGAAA